MDDSFNPKNMKSFEVKIATCTVGKSQMLSKLTYQTPTATEQILKIEVLQRKYIMSIERTHKTIRNLIKPLTPEYEKMSTLSYTKVASFGM